MPVEWIPRLVEADIVRQDHRQVFLRHRHDTATRAVHDGDRTAPIALARGDPVAQAIGGLAFAIAALGKPGDDCRLGLLDVEAVEKIRVDQHTVFHEGLAGYSKALLGVAWAHHGKDR